MRPLGPTTGQRSVGSSGCCAAHQSSRRRHLRSPAARRRTPAARRRTPAARRRSPAARRRTPAAHRRSPGHHRSTPAGGNGTCECSLETVPKRWDASAASESRPKASGACARVRVCVCVCGGGWRWVGGSDGNGRGWIVRWGRLQRVLASLLGRLAVWLGVPGLWLHQTPAAPRRPSMRARTTGARAHCPDRLDLTTPPPHSLLLLLP